ncbi:hypothetical protein [uncultured Kordia sp.]|uniref:hypothetical protein n=1 Tax=uncultured Kordia sp. TaxID=507699 RepID=UPI00262C3721|nr:hypothetical protein [uncultured Kordia sp.]
MANFKQQTKATLQRQESKKTKIQTTKFILYVAAIISVIAVFSHVFFPTTDYEVANARSAHKKVKKERDNKFTELRDNYENYSKGQISNQDFEELNKALLETYFNLYDESNLKYKELNSAKQDAKVFYFKNMNVFLYQTSVFVVLFILSILFFISLQLIEYKSLKRAYQFCSFAFMAIAFYYLVWIFYPKSDLPYFAYIFTMLGIAIILTIAARYFLKWLLEKKSVIFIHKENFKRLWYFIINITPNFITDKQKKEQYVDGYTKEIEEFKIPYHEES